MSKKSPKQAQASIDLHGCRKDVAIAKVTDFLENAREQNKKWVSIITGTGSHSPNGPVLREAVRSLLERRKMEYSLQPGKGGFLVNAASGETFMAAPEPVDTKVVMAEACADNVKLVGRPPVACNEEEAEPILNATCEPLPRDVATDDALMEQIKNKSAQEHLFHLHKENLDLKEAMTASLNELQERKEQDIELEQVLAKSQDDQGDDTLARALKLSQLEDERLKQEQAKLEEILQASRIEEEQHQKQEEALLQRALSVSQIEISQDAELQDALQKSLNDMSSCRELNEALSQSLKENLSIDEPDELLVTEAATCKKEAAS